MKLSLFTFLFLVLLLNSGCISAFTTGAAVAVGIHDSSQKRAVWTKRAEEGDVYSQYELAQSYCCGSLEGEKSPVQAVRWLCVAARNGFAKAQVDLGKLYENRVSYEGLNMKKDQQRAYMWYKLASRRANSEASNLLDKLEKNMTGREIRQAQILVRDNRAVSCGVTND